MNRIILIGNGFDLAHGMKTSYKDFINVYIYHIKEHLRLKFIDFPTKMVTTNMYFYEDEELIFKIEEVRKNKETLSCQDIIEYSSFKNKFFQRIMKLSLNNWVDIEEEYFNQVKLILEEKSEYKDIGNKKAIQFLNEDFQRIKDKLVAYLKRTYELESTSLNLSIGSVSSYNLNISGFRIPTSCHKISNLKEDIYSPFNLNDFNETGQRAMFLENYQEMKKTGENLKESDIKEIPGVPYNESNFLIDWLKNGLPNEEQFINYAKFGLKTNQYNPTKIPDNFLFLNFNYTYTERLYFYDYSLDKGIDVIHIHGELENSENPIIFGYGDETDGKYSEIENLNDNNYLDNVKSIKYSETQNYKKLLDFINSDKYQIFVMGHSCGISDRTLLKTLFEHENCVSIKIRTYKYKDSSGNEVDNFSNIVRNISRHFSDKTLMRDKLVNKEYS